MNTKFEILDCTLRDGGYYTQWDFDQGLVERYFNHMNVLPVDILEIGYRSIPQESYMGKYFYMPDFELEKIEKMGISKEIAIMLNEKNTRPENLSVLLPGLKPIVNLIRLAVDPINFDRALLLAEKIKEAGFDVAFNIMYMSKYYKNSYFLSKLKYCDSLVRYLNIVDSFGGLIPNQLKELISNVQENSNATLGFHGHNNMELAFANTLTAIQAGCKIVDVTLAGMGRGAGNLKTELLLTHLASIGSISFNFNILTSLLDDWEDLQHEYNWGTNLPYMVSGANSLPQKDVMEWVTQRFYSYNSIIQALHNKKSGYKDNIKLPSFIPERSYENVVIIGGGPNAVFHFEAITEFISGLDDVSIIHASSKNAKIYENVTCKQYYCLVGNEGHRLEQVFNNLEQFHGECILPPYPRKMGTYIPSVLKDISYELTEVNFTDKYQDAHTALAFQTALELSPKNIFLVGYDGYSKELITNKEQALITENEYLFKKLALKNTRLFSLLPSNYSVRTKSVYSILTNKILRNCE